MLRLLFLVFCAPCLAAPVLVDAVGRFKIEGQRLVLIVAEGTNNQRTLIVGSPRGARDMDAWAGRAPALLDHIVIIEGLYDSKTFTLEPRTIRGTVYNARLPGGGTGIFNRN